MSKLILWQRIEGLLVFVAGLALFWQLGGDLPWWAAIALFFAPDLSFLAYAMGPRTGALVYNGVHIYGFGAALLALGLIASAPLLVGVGSLWLAHSGFDRLFGYGLKSDAGFSITHLGRIGKER